MLIPLPLTRNSRIGGPKPPKLHKTEHPGSLLSGELARGQKGRGQGGAAQSRIVYWRDCPVRPLVTV